MNARVPALVWCPFGDDASARHVAGRLLDEGLVSCANIFPAVQSLYVWNGERGESAEIGVLFKTDSQRLDAAIARIEALHPYKTPAILGWLCGSASSATVRWLCGGPDA